MNYWRLQNFFFAVFYAMLGLFFSAIGVVGIFLPWSTTFQATLIKVLTEDTVAISLAGVAFFFLGFWVFAFLLMKGRKRYYHLKNGKHLVVLDETVFEEYLEGYWKQLFPQYAIGYKILLKKNQLHVIADLPSVTLPQQKFLLEKIRAELQDLFQQFLGFRGEFFFSASFCQDKP